MLWEQLVQEIHTLACVLETSYNARIGFQDALTKLSDVINEIEVELVAIKILKS